MDTVWLKVHQSSQEIYIMFGSGGIVRFLPNGEETILYSALADSLPIYIKESPAHIMAMLGQIRGTTNRVDPQYED